jgi:hypothetical protein
MHCEKQTKDNTRLKSIFPILLLIAEWNHGGIVHAAEMT